jgi:hypothetical protein
VPARVWTVAEATVDDALGDLSARDRAQLARLMGRVKGRLLDMAGTSAGGSAPAARAAAS